MIDKLSSTAKKLNTFFKVLQRIIIAAVIVVVCVLAVITVAEFINLDTVIGTGLNIIDIGPMSFELAQENAPSDLQILGLSWVIAVVGIFCAMAIWYGLGCIRKILIPMSEGRPFHPDTSKQFRKLAWLSLVVGVLQNIAANIEVYVSVKTFGIAELIKSTAIQGVTVNYTFEAGFIILFFILLLMGYLFDYGADLQTLSDETL